MSANAKPRRKFWGWGYEGRGPSEEQQRRIAELLAGRFGLSAVPEAIPAPRVEDLSLRAPRLDGDRLAFEMMDERGVLRAYEGRVSGDRIEGATRAGDGTAGTFSAVRTGAATPVDAGRD